MKFDYYVHVIAKNIVAGEKEEHDFLSTASLTGDDKDYILTYEEISEGESFRTSIHVVDGKTVYLKRAGEMSTLMTIEERVRNMSEIITPFGRITLGVIGTKIESDFGEDKGTLTLCYTTYSDKEPLGSMKFHFEYYKKGTESNSTFF